MIDVASVKSHKKYYTCSVNTGEEENDILPLRKSSFDIEFICFWINQWVEWRMLKDNSLEMSTS